MSKVKIAITGGIGSGKSTVSKYIQSLGYPVYSCDEINKEIFQTVAFQERLKQLFPACEKDGKIDKKLLSSCVFSDKVALRALNELAHPFIMAQLDSELETCKENYVFAEVPLLFECGYEDRFDFVIIVFRSLEDRISAVSLRDQSSPELVQQRIAAQWDYNEAKMMSLPKSKYVVLKNELTISDLNKKIDDALAFIMKQ